jgi:hypothetical protein
LLFVRDDHYACLWAGDSRAYRLRGDQLRQLTHDHSLVQELLDGGAISPAEVPHHPGRNVITCALGGADEAAELDNASDRLRAGDRFLLCSGGLCKTVAEPDLAALMTTGDDGLAGRLVAAALNRQADDNVTAVVIVLALDIPNGATRGSLPRFGGGAMTPSAKLSAPQYHGAALPTERLTTTPLITGPVIVLIKVKNFRSSSDFAFAT